MVLDEVKGFLIYGWGDRVGFGYLFRKLKPVTTATVREYISTNKPLFGEVPDSEWPKWQALLEEYNLMKHITKERFVREFQKHRPDLYDVVEKEANGLAWLDAQVATIRVKLGIDAPITEWRRVITPPPPPS